MSDRVFVVGVGMTKFEKPGARDWDYPDMGREAGQKALADAGIAYDEVEQAVVGYCYGDSTAGQRALYELGLTRHPDRQRQQQLLDRLVGAVPRAPASSQGGLADCVLALGFEKMEKGWLGRSSPTARRRWTSHVRGMMNAPRASAEAPAAPQMFGNAGREYMERYGVTAETFAKIGEKNHRHSVNNPYSQFRDEYTLEEILAAPMVYEPLTKLQCCPTSDGGAAAVLASERFVDEHGLRDQAVEIVGQAMTTDYADTFDGSDMNLVGYRHDQAQRRRQGLRGVRARARGRRGHRAARLLQRQRDDHLRGPRPVRARARPASSSTRAPTPTAASGWSTRRAA